MDAVITEPCSTLVTSDGYGLTGEGERVLYCVVGGAALYLIVISEKDPMRVDSQSRSILP